MKEVPDSAYIEFSQNNHELFFEEVRKHLKDSYYIVKTKLRYIEIRAFGTDVLHWRRKMGSRATYLIPSYLFNLKR